MSGDLTKAEIKKAQDRTETLLSQLATHSLRTYYPDLSGAERSAAVEHFIETYGQSMTDVLDGMLAMSVDAAVDDEEEDEEEEEEEEEEEDEDEDEEEDEDE